MTFTEYLRYINLKDKSIKRYIKVIDSFFSILNKENVEEVRVEDIRSYIENLKEINKARTINQKLAILRQYIIYSSIKTQDNYGEYVVNLKNCRNIFTGVSCINFVGWHFNDEKKTSIFANVCGYFF